MMIKIDDFLLNNSFLAVDVFDCSIEAILVISLVIQHVGLTNINDDWLFEKRFLNPKCFTF